jgi:hypothetical protein
MGLVVPAIAQTGFPDVKDTHWAADSVNRLKLSGLVHGFKDGNYSGDRTMTRYEMASAVYAIYAKLVCFDEEVDKKIKALEAKINSIKPNEAPAAPDLSDIKSALASMKNDVGTIKSWGADLAQLKKMSSAYSNELKSLGVDIKDMQKNISDVSARVAKLEVAPGGINISGDANFWMAAAATADGANAIVNQDGMYIGSNSTGAGFDSLTVLNEFGLKIEDKKASVPYSAEFVIGNTTNDGSGFGNQIYDPNNFGQRIFSGNDSVWIHELTAKYRPFNMTAGRQGVKLNKFILARPDTTSFYSQKRWDDHTFRMDGAKFGFGSNDAGTLFVGTVSNATNTNGKILQPIQLATLSVQRMMGASYDFKLGDKGKLSASYIDFDGSLGIAFALAQPLLPITSGVTRQNVYGLDLAYDLGGMMLEAGGGKSTALGIAPPVNGAIAQNGKTGSDIQNLDTLIDTANSRWDVAIGSHNFRLGYRSVEANYIAPGDWGRISVFRNLTDTRAYFASGSLQLTKKVGVHGWYEKGEAIAGIGGYKSWRVGVESDLTSKWEADLSFEDTMFTGGFQGLINDTSTKFMTLRLGYDLGEKRSLNVFWQQSQYDGLFMNEGINGVGKGSMFGFQYSLKF